MKTKIKDSKYDTKIEASDWRFSAAILGLMQYLSHHNFDFEVDDEYLLYNSQDIDEEKYLQFIEYKYSGELHHTVVESILSSDDISDGQVKIVNEKLIANTIMKKHFNKIKFDGSNKEQILNIISKNRSEIAKETFGKKSNLYANYISVNMKAPIELFKEEQNYCRLVGYSCSDENRKSNSIGYNFVKNNYVSSDILEFDFIPLAFTGDREAFFINDNFTLQRLKNTNYILAKKVELDQGTESKNIDARQSLFKGIIESADFIDYDVEVIFKDKEKEYFETLYFRKDVINILKELKNSNFNYKSICFSYKINEKYYINIQKEVTNSILNNIVLDEIIELILKDKEKKDRRLKNNSYLVNQLININVLIRGDKEMKDRLKGSFACAKQVAEILPSNKIDSYRQKLTSSIIFKDYDRVCQILLQLSNYSNIEFGFVYDLYENFEDNKDLAYTFINALSKNKDKKADENN
ncbi:MAG: type I CRISPR-associated protein Cas8a1/Csx8 [Peptostreptococcaceae bacterium]